MFTSDVDASKSFYEALFGWTIKQEKVGDLQYTMIYAGDTPIGGLVSLAIIQTEGIAPHWLAYVSVADVSQAALTACDSGGQVLVEPRDMGIASFTVLQDPTNAVIAAWRSHRGDPPAMERPPVGMFSWDQLAGPDTDKAAEFYQKVFGWQLTPFEGADDRWVFTSGKRMVASFWKAPMTAMPHWLNFVVVDKLNVARDKTLDLGGKVLFEEVTMLDIGKFAVIGVNVGALIALLQVRSGLGVVP